MRNRFWSAVPVAAVCLAFGLSTTSCGGGGPGTDAELVLLGFNQPNVAGVALNQPLIFTFSADVDYASITPDTLRIVGSTGPFFEATLVDGNLVALLPRSPNFDDYSDVGLFPNVLYSVSMPTFPSVDTIESTAGKPLLSAKTFTFRTVPTNTFIEARRGLQHGLPPSLGGRSDDEGCLQNPQNELYKPPALLPLPQQSNSVAGGRLLCLMNEGAPHILRNACSPTHDQRAVGTPAAGSQNIGKISLPAIRIAANELLDPPTVTPYPSTKLPVNVQLWRVGLLNGTPIVPEGIQVNKPLIVQSLAGVEIILVASDAVLQGIYMVNVTANVKDLQGNRLVLTDEPNLAGTVYQPVDPTSPAVPQGYRYFFQTLQIAGAASAINESFGTNLAEWGDSASQNTEPGVFTQSTVTTAPLTAMGSTVPAGMATDAFTLLFGSATAGPVVAPQFTPFPFTTTLGLPALQCGQTTTANWNDGFRFLNLASLEVNTDADGGVGMLKAVWRPYLGTGGDGVFDSDTFPFVAGPGDSFSLSTTPGSGASVNNDGVFEYESFFLHAGDSMTITGTRPCLILCRGDFQVDGTIDLSGTPGGPGLDTDGSTDYTNTGAVQVWGPGGIGGPGGGAGGRGAGPLVGSQNPASAGGAANDLFGPFPGGSVGVGGVVNSTTTLVAAGGGGGFGVAGTGGTRNDASAGGGGGAVFSSARFERAVRDFQLSTAPAGPDRGYNGNAAISGGTGGGGGGIEDDSSSVESSAGNGTVENQDDGGGGGGGGGGGLWVIAGGTVRVGASGQITANGGAGGNTYSRANQSLNGGTEQGNADDFIQGLIPGAVPSGQGGPGGGGSGGGILLIGEGVSGAISPGTTVNIQAGAQLRALGGAGGQVDVPGTANPKGGAGGNGRICLLGIGAAPGAPLGSVLPAPTLDQWRPTVVGDSVGQCQWIDLFTPTVVFNPVVGGSPQKPFDTDNFETLRSAGKLAGTAVSDDFCAIWEFQGCDSVSYTTPALPAAPTAVAAGLTQWNSDPTLCNGKRFVRWRWRFHVRPTYSGMGLTASPMPAVLDLTIPFTK